jgi:hypothetical protein
LKLFLSFEHETFSRQFLLEKSIFCFVLSSDGGQAVVGEFRMVLRKVNGSLGFTLQSTDETVLKHTVKVGIFRGTYSPILMDCSVHE